MFLTVKSWRLVGEAALTENSLRVGLEWRPRVGVRPACKQSQQHQHQVWPSPEHFTSTRTFKCIQPGHSGGADGKGSQTSTKPLSSTRGQHGWTSALKLCNVQSLVIIYHQLITNRWLLTIDYESHGRPAWLGLCSAALWVEFCNWLSSQ